MPKSYSSIWIHLIWTTKNRHPLLDKKFRRILYRYIKLNCEEKGYLIDTINGIEDHLHCLVRLLPGQKLSDMVRQIKGASSRWINVNGRLDLPFSWQRGYAAISVSPKQINNIRNYIRNQESHHEHWKLDEEFETLGISDWGVE
ncbi:MAG: IS200/IS605 family transposase [Balneolaceae bacterium]|nr:IS200/IS605 family transposase [Balneolaceae bacterium]